MIAKAFSTQLLAWYQLNKRDLPWRRTLDPYKIWISEIMLQQTTVTAVIPYFERWVRRYPTMETLARAREKSVLKSWEGLGYYSRVRNIHGAARIMVRDYGGKVPDDPKILLKLPGFGPYTVGAVLSIAYGLRQPIIDANVRRIVMRLQAMEGKADASLDVRILPVVKKLLPEDRMSEFNQAFMELGALVCGKQPLCDRCPVSGLCQAYALGKQDLIPVSKKMIYVDLNVVVGVFRRRNQFYIRRRPDKGILAGLWEFPGGRIEEGESHGEALARVIRELCGVELQESQHLMRARHSYTNHRIKQHVYACAATGDLIEDETHRWVTSTQMKKFAMHSGSLRIVEKLCSSGVAGKLVSNRRSK